MSCPFYKAITSSYETPRDWNFTFLHHLYVSRYLLWQIAIPHPIRSDFALPPCFSVFEQKMTVNKSRLVECKSIIPSKWFSHMDLLFALTLNTLYTKAESTKITFSAKCAKIMCMILKEPLIAAGNEIMHNTWFTLLFVMSTFSLLYFKAFEYYTWSLVYDVLDQQHYVATLPSPINLLGHHSWRTAFATLK